MHEQNGELTVNFACLLYQCLPGSFTLGSLALLSMPRTDGQPKLDTISIISLCNLQARIAMWTMMHTSLCIIVHTSSCMLPVSNADAMAVCSAHMLCPLDPICVGVSADLTVYMHPALVLALLQLRLLRHVRELSCSVRAGVQDTSTGHIIAQHRTKMGPCDVLRQNPYNAVSLLGHAQGVVTMWTPNMSTPVIKMLAHKVHSSHLRLCSSANRLFSHARCPAFCICPVQADDELFPVDMYT